MRISDWCSDVCSSDLYGLDIATAGALASIYIIPASVFRHYGGKLSDRYGARAVMYVVIGISVLCIFMLAYPPPTYIIDSARGPIRSEVRRVGKECFSTCSYRWAPLS